MEERRQQNKDDHDLIIRLDTKMDDIRSDIKELKDGTHQRLTDVENHKLNIKDSYPALYKASVEKSLSDLDIITKKHENEITRILTFGTAGILVLGIVEFLIGKFI